MRDRRCMLLVRQGRPPTYLPRMSHKIICTVFFVSVNSGAPSTTTGETTSNADAVVTIFMGNIDERVSDGLMKSIINVSHLSFSAVISIVNFP